MREIYQQELKKVDYINAILALDNRYMKIRGRLWAKSLLELRKLYYKVNKRVRLEKSTDSQPVGRSQGGKDD